VSIPSRYSYPRYLTAKRSVDARALNHHVWTSFLEALAGNDTLRILEVGGGVGASVERIIDELEDRSVKTLDYTFVDVTPENVDEATSSLRDWGQSRGYTVSGDTEQKWTSGPIEVTLSFLTADLFNVDGFLDEASYDALVAQAVLDLLPLPSAIRALRPLLRNGGLWYLPLHFDGVTALEPTTDACLDATIERLYHQSMSGPEAEREGARSGRTLLTQLPSLGAQILSAGSSDWVVYPRSGSYPGDEAYFLHHILHFVETELRGHPDLCTQSFSAWIDRRRQQIEQGTLIYIAHQLDILARNVAQEG